MSNKHAFLNFIKDLNEDAARSAKEMEDLLFSDAPSSIVKAGVVIEGIINDVYKVEGITNEPFESLASKIFQLYKQGYIKRDIYDSFTKVRKERNKAAHGSSSPSLVSALLCHEEIYNIAKWYVESYGPVDVQIPTYQYPKQKQPDMNELVEDKFKEISKMIEGIAAANTPANPSKTDKTDNELDRKVQGVNKGELKETTEEHNPNKAKYSNDTTLLDEITRLRDSSQEAIENADHFSDFKRYLHIRRKIQKDLEGILDQKKEGEFNNLILLCGSVGDGKSHLLAYLNKERPELMSQYKVFNDATESISPSMDAMETLEENLKLFSDELLGKTTEKVILAINMGVLHNFINNDHQRYSYDSLKNFIDSSELFTEKVTTTYNSEHFNLISFGDYHYYELEELGPSSSFYEELLNRIVNPTIDNPFYAAYLRDQNRGWKSLVHLNYEFLQEETVRKQIVQLIIRAIVEEKLVISARAFSNFIADIIIPDYVEEFNTLYTIDHLQYTLPNLLFNRSERSEILNVIKKFDPIHKRSKELDDVYIQVHTQQNLGRITEDYGLSEISKEILLPFLNLYNTNESSSKYGIKTFIRILLLSSEDFSTKLLDPTTKEYLLYVYAFNIKRKDYIKQMYDMVNTCIYLWQGNIDREYIFIERNVSKYKIAQKLNISPDISHIPRQDVDKLESFRPTIQLKYTDQERHRNIELDIDFILFRLLKKIEKGYLPNKNDEENAVKFVEFIDKIMTLGQKKKEILIHYPEDKKNYLLSRDGFGGYVFERKQ